MKKYVVSYINLLYDDHIQMIVTEAENSIEALYHGYDYFGSSLIRKDISSIEDFYKEIDINGMMGVLEI